MHLFKKSLVALTVSSLLGASAVAATDSRAQQNPYAMYDDAWIAISGTVESASPNSFRLDYGDGLITVEMDDWDWYHEGHQILKGDKVTVYGYIDDNLFETTSIEASAVYVKGLNSFFFASAADEEDPRLTTIYVPSVYTTIQGTVQEIKGRDITLDTGEGTLTVGTQGLSENPLDKEGYQQIKVGDRISVTGQMDKTFFGERKFKAETITTLSADKTKKAKSRKDQQS